MQKIRQKHHRLTTQCYKFLIFSKCPRAVVRAADATELPSSPLLAISLVWLVVRHHIGRFLGWRLSGGPVIVLGGSPVIIVSAIVDLVIGAPATIAISSAR